MFYVRLLKAWTDSDGVRHEAGDIVQVDYATFVRLEAGRVAERLGPSERDGAPPTVIEEGGGGPGVPRGRPPGTDFDDDR